MTELNKETQVAAALLGYLDAIYWHSQSLDGWEQQLQELGVDVEAIRGLAITVSREKDNQVQPGDVYLEEIRTGWFSLWRHTRESGWRYINPISEQEAEELIKSMQFLRGVANKRRFYRPTDQAEKREEQGK